MTIGVEGNGSRRADEARHDELDEERREPFDAGADRPDGHTRAPLTEQQKRILAVALVVHALVVVLTLRDLRRRPAAGVRGPKWVWGVAATLNTSGSLAYWIFGRRRGIQSTG